MSFLPRATFPSYRVPLSDFKGHHNRALLKMQQLAPQLDLVLEVRDARAPISTRNVLFDRALKGTEKIILYSKYDLSGIKTGLFEKWHGRPQLNLSDKVEQKEIEYDESNFTIDRERKKQKEDWSLVDCRNKDSAKNIINLLRQKYNQMYPPPPLGLRVMITGMPNVGKSTLVNSLRGAGLASKGSKKVAKTGGQPGVTRSTSEIIRISNDPDILLYDTPGVFMPQVKDAATMCSLAIIGAVKPTAIDPVIQADFLLYLMNLQDQTGKYYSEYLRKPSNDINLLLREISKKVKKYNAKTGQYDEIGTALWWIDRWRQGKEDGACLFDLEALVKNYDFNMQESAMEETQRIENFTIISSKPGAEKRVSRSNMLFKK